MCGAADVYCGSERDLDGLPPDPLLRHQLLVDFRYWVQLRYPKMAKHSAGATAAYAAALDEWDKTKGRISTSP